jgi:hypothetical protein
MHNTARAIVLQFLGLILDQLVQYLRRGRLR